MNTLASIALVCGLAALPLATALTETQGSPMKLGSFTVCLVVKDIKASKSFYEKLDFKEVSGDMKKNWIVLQNGTTKIGLFQGLFEKNLLSFNPGVTPEREVLKEFQDVREIQHVLKERGVKLQSEVDEKSDGPAGFMIVDPDGNQIMIDQHVPRPKK